MHDRGFPFAGYGDRDERFLLRADRSARRLEGKEMHREAGMSEVATPRVKVRAKVERPRLYKVILINDDYTPREFLGRGC